MRQFDVPVVLEMAPSATGARHYVALMSLERAEATLAFGATTETVSLSDVEQEWDGTFVVLWKPPRPAFEPNGRGAKGWGRRVASRASGRGRRSAGASRAGRARVRR